jgi:hypothetical protein
VLACSDGLLDHSGLVGDWNGHGNSMDITAGEKRVERLVSGGVVRVDVDLGFGARGERRS